MPPLPKTYKEKTITLPQRTATVAAKTDVLVVGGGPAGIGAALGAAQAGAEVILTERYGFLGGNATAALVLPFTGYHSCTHSGRIERKVTLLPHGCAGGRPAIAGVVKTLIDRLVLAGGALPPSPDTGYTIPFDPEIVKETLFEMLDEARVYYLLHSFASDVVTDDALRGVVFATKSGPIVIEARVTIDCTGDGDIAAWSGAPFEVGREEDRLVQPMSLLFRVVDFDWRGFTDYVQKRPDQWRDVYGLWELIEEATEAGELRLEREDMLFFATPHQSEISVNSTRVVRVMGTDVWDLTYAEWQGRRQLTQIVSFLKERVPGFENSWLIDSGSQIGVRETRRIMGEHYLTAGDLLSARHFPEVVAQGTYPLDIHNPEGKGTIFMRPPEGKAYQIPLGALLPLGVENLLVAGRCISGTHEAHSGYRAMPICMATGHAAGVCAALAVLQRLTPRRVKVHDVQLELLRQGAELGGIQEAVLEYSA